MNTTASPKEIKPIFQSAGRKRRKLLGFEAWYFGSFIGIFNTYAAAELQLECVAFELGRVAT